ncbi:MAG: AraC family transcriptional regulator [Treponema sp.]|jgi:AraC-like DNA-binding protein|nr:AraC family transcriptional regulator [Treponema sp.]
MKKRNVSENFFVYFDITKNPQAPLYITTVGKASIAPHETYPYNWKEHPKKYTMNWEKGRVLDEYQFLFISEGSGRLRSFEGEFPIRPDNLVVLVPGEKHRYIPDQETGWTEHWIGFTGTIPDEWIAGGLLEKVITIHPILNHMETLTAFEEAVNFARDRRYAVQPLIVSCVTRIFAYLTEDQYLRLNRTSYDIIEESKNIFEKNIYHPIGMTDLTGILHINYQHLRNQFRIKTGLSPYQYFLQMKIDKAKELLQEGALSIKEISYKLSFESPYYFSRLFKRKTGIAPSQWNSTAYLEDLN